MRDGAGKFGWLGPPLSTVRLTNGRGSEHGTALTDDKTTLIFMSYAQCSQDLVSMTCSVLICLACPAFLSHIVPDRASSSVLLHKFLQIFSGDKQISHWGLGWGTRESSFLSPTEEADRKSPLQNSIEKKKKSLSLRFDFVPK